MNLTAPAKINLSLRVLGKRPDGFHEIKTLMLPLSLHDRVELRRNNESGLVFQCSDPSLPTDDSNLAVRAARLFFEALGETPGVAITLEKAIPHGAGLAGGSSDAAAVLRGLSALWGEPLSVEKLHAIAATLGSDVPFFLQGGAAWCTGRGETVTPAPFPHRLRLLLFKPEFGIPTPWAYRQWRDSQELPGVPYGVQTLPFGEVVNDLERPVFEKYLFLAVVKRWLLQQPEVEAAAMSGSGSTSFAILREGADGEVLKRRAEAALGQGWFTLCETATTAPRETLNKASSAAS